MACTELAGKTVLVVDDEPEMPFLIKRLLASFDCQVLTASNSLEAHELYDKHRAEMALVITDVMMPDINGIELIKSLRLRHSRVPVIVVSGLAIKAGLANDIDEANINAWLSKPFSGTSFKQMINDLLCEDE